MHCAPVIVFAVALLPALAQKTPQGSSSKPSAHSVSPDPGSTREGVYRNSSFGFSYKVPFGWVDRMEQMRDDSSDGAKAMVLLSMFERPPEAEGETVNSAVVIAAESVASYPGLKTAADYFEPLTEATTSKGFKVEQEPYNFALGGKMLVRGDFSKELGQQKMFQSSLAMVIKGYVVSYTFIGGSEGEVENLVQNLSFGPAGSSIRK